MDNNKFIDLLKHTEDKMDVLTMHLYDTIPSFREHIASEVKRYTEIDSWDEYLLVLERHFLSNSKVELKMTLKDFPILSLALANMDIDTTHKIVDANIYGNIVLVKYERFEFQ